MYYIILLKIGKNYENLRLSKRKNSEMLCIIQYIMQNNELKRRRADKKLESNKMKRKF